MWRREAAGERTLDYGKELEHARSFSLDYDPFALLEVPSREQEEERWDSRG